MQILIVPRRDGILRLAENAVAAVEDGFKAIKAAPFDGFPSLDSAPRDINAARDLGIACSTPEKSGW